MKDYFTLKASVVDGKVEISIIPAEAIKQNIKDDKAAEKKKE